MTVIISAIEFEVHPLISRISKDKFKYFPCGIGSLNAARNEITLKERCRDEDVIFIGSCGTLGDFKGIELVTIDKVYWLPACERLGHSWSIEGLSPSFDLKVGDICSNLPRKSALTSPTIAKTDFINPDIIKMYGLPENSDLVENLELYSCQSIFAVAKTFNVILAVTNKVCSEGRVQWRNNFKAAAEKTADFVAEKLENLLIKN